MLYFAHASVSDHITVYNRHFFAISMESIGQGKTILAHEQYKNQEKQLIGTVTIQKSRKTIDWIKLVLKIVHVIM